MNRVTTLDYATPQSNAHSPRPRRIWPLLILPAILTIFWRSTAPSCLQQFTDQLKHLNDAYHWHRPFWHLPFIILPFPAFLFALALTTQRTTWPLLRLCANLIAAISIVSSTISIGVEIAQSRSIALPYLPLAITIALTPIVIASRRKMSPDHWTLLLLSCAYSIQGLTDVQWQLYNLRVLRGGPQIMLATACTTTCAALLIADAWRSHR